MDADQQHGLLRALAQGVDNPGARPGSTSASPLLQRVQRDAERDVWQVGVEACTLWVVPPAGCRPSVAASARSWHPRLQEGGGILCHKQHAGVREGWFA
jgi:hypothetical protein